MRKPLRIALIAGGSLLGLIVLGWLGLALYVHLNKHTFLEQINRELNQRLNGKVTIRDIEPSLIRSFPHISMALEEVSLQDSLWEQHKHPLLSAQRIFVKVNTFSVLHKKLDVRQITLEDGAFYLFTNSQGYTNTHVLKPRKRQHKPGKRRDADIAGLELRNMQFVLENQQKQKLFRLAINNLKGQVHAADTGWVLDINTTIHVLDFAFNTAKGSFLKDKDLRADLHLSFNREHRTLHITRQTLYIGQQPVILNGQFSFAQPPPAFSLDITAEKMPFREAASLLSPNISRKLDSIDLLQPLDLEARLQGHMRYRDTPWVRVNWKTSDNTLVTRVGQWTECSFNGDFNNEYRPGKGHNDENTEIHMYRFKGRWFGVPLEADTIHVTNLKHPVLAGRFRSNFPLTDLNAATGETFAFKSGTAAMDLFYSGGVMAGDTVQPFLHGSLELKDGALSYLPRNLDFRNCNATLRFTGHDLYLQNVRIQSAKSTLQMEGSARNFFHLYFKEPEKILLDWTINSPLIDLDEFRFFLAPRRKSRKHGGSGNAKQKKANHIASQLEVVMEACNVNMQLQVDKLNYRRFDARQVKAAIAMAGPEIRLNRISLSHAGGSLLLTGNVQQQGNDSRFRLQSTISNVHIDQLFYAFDNFGMQALTSQNLKGVLSAKANITGTLRDNGQLARRSLYGTVSFDLRQGALVHFRPLEDIGVFFFRKRNLSNITFENLRNTLEIKGNRIIIPPMQIASSAVNMDVSGVYGIPSGTDILLDVPLRNPKKDEGITDKEEKRKRSRKGIVLHLRATDDNKEGKVKIKLR